MSVVYVTQIPNRRDAATGTMVPVFDISPAAKHGTISVIMPPSASFYHTHEMVKALRNMLCRYNYIDGDSLVASGDPTVIAAAGAIIAEHSRDIRILKWDKVCGEYIPIEIHL